MKKNIFQIIQLFGLILLLHSCNAVTPYADYKSLARASTRLGMDIDYGDNHKLYLESSQWLGVPYRNGGNSKKGIDCSGLTGKIYDKVYQVRLQRNTSAQMKECSMKLTKRQLREGDLVFFKSPRSGNKVGHVGIYLKNGKFIHASVTSGVIVSNLNEPYYCTHWIGGGRLENVRYQRMETARK